MEPVRVQCKSNAAKGDIRRAHRSCSLERHSDQIRAHPFEHSAGDQPALSLSPSAMSSSVPTSLFRNRLADALLNRGVGGEALQNFTGITGASEQQARFYLESSNGDLEVPSSLARPMKLQLTRLCHYRPL